MHLLGASFQKAKVPLDSSIKVLSEVAAKYLQKFFVLFWVFLHQRSDLVVVVI